MKVAAVSMFVFLLLVPGSIRAGCCNLVKTDEESATVIVRVCEQSGLSCGNVLFEGSMSVGSVENVCTLGDTIFYQEDDGSGFTPSVEARCTGLDIEI